MIRLLQAVLCTIFITNIGIAQTNVGVGTTTPSNPLHVFSTGNPLRIEGVVGGATTDSILTLNPSGIVRKRTVAAVLSGGGGWLQTGNTGSTTTFLGTINAAGLYFRTNNLKAGFIDFDSTKRNNSYGNRALNSFTTGTGNNALGYQSLTALTTGNNNVAIGDSSAFSITTGSDNITIGADAGSLLGIGIQNIAIGTRSLDAAVAGSNNIAIGTQAMENNVASTNIAIGTLALNKNTFGSDNLAVGTNALSTLAAANNINIAIGNNALQNATTSTEQLAVGFNSGLNVTNGAYNTLIGHYALGGTFTAATNYNTIVGYQAGAGHTSGSNNTYMGYLAGGPQIGGSNNTYIGYQAGPTAANSYTNSVAIGSGAPVASSNLVRLGNTSTTVIGGAVGFSTLSDERVKKNIQEDVKGLAFIALLRPVTYNYDLQKADDFQKVPLTARASYTEKQGIRYSGFLAQEVENAAKQADYNFSGVNKPQNDQTLYSINYSEIVVPLVKAVQELKSIVEKQQQEIEKLKVQLANK